MLDTSQVTESLARAKEYAARTGLADDLERQLEVLTSFGRDPERFRAVLYPDLAPYSFAFVIERRDSEGTWRPRLTGSLRYHNPHDGFGSGTLPTLAMTLETSRGWSIHAGKIVVSV